MYGDYTELEERSSLNVALRVKSPAAVYVAGVKGGARAHVMDSNGEWIQDHGAHSDGEVETERGPGGRDTIKIVRIEQSYV
jgi:hypothetical protein